VARGEDIPRRAMADACLVVENMAASVCVWVCVGGEGVESGEWWRDDEVLDVGGAFDDPKSLAWRSNQRVVIGWRLDTLTRCRGGVTCEHQHQIINLLRVYRILNTIESFRKAF
jgi:hypothetical protein